MGILDGCGLAMFLPLLQLVDGTKTATTDEMGNLSFIIAWLEDIGLPLTLSLLLIIIGLFFIFKGLANYFKGWYQVTLQQLFIKSIRLKTINALKQINYKHFITSDVGRIQNTLTGEVDRVARAYQSYFLAFQQMVMVIVYMSFAFLVDYEFAILVSIGGLISNLIYKQIYKNTKGISAKLTLSVHYYQGLIIQAVSSFKYLKASGQLDFYTGKLTRQIEFIETNNRRIGILAAILTSSREPLTIIVVCFVIFTQVSVLGSPLSAILISLLFFYRALNSLMQMQTAWNTYLSVSGSLDNMAAFTKELQANKEDNGNVNLKGFSDKIQLKDVTFNYGDTQILKDINLDIKKNESIAFVGESGSGKTTLVNIIAGLFPVDSGKMTVDNIDRANLDLTSLQSKIGYITQDPVIFNDTIFNNVTFWANKTDDNVRRYKEAIKKAAIYDFIISLPKGGDTELGNNGMNLSGGQKQRISIARELYKDIDILILDEATSALDSETEKAIQDNMESLKGLYTMIMVAHRLSTIRNVDRIVFLKHGTISSIDTFEGLIKKVPEFKRMIELQELTAKES